MGRDRLRVRVFQCLNTAKVRCRDKSSRKDPKPRVFDCLRAPVPGRVGGPRGVRCNAGRSCVLIGAHPGQIGWEVLGGAPDALLLAELHAHGGDGRGAPAENNRTVTPRFEVNNVATVSARRTEHIEGGQKTKRGEGGCSGVGILGPKALAQGRGRKAEVVDVGEGEDERLGGQAARGVRS